MFDAERHHVEWTSYLTPQALIDLVASRSYCITSPEKVRTRTLDRVRDLLTTHPALANTNGLAAVRHGGNQGDAGLLLGRAPAYRHVVLAILVQ